MSHGFDGRTAPAEVHRDVPNGRPRVLHDVPREGEWEMNTVEMDVANLEVCDRTRVRKTKPNINGDIVEEYAEAYRCGLILEPLDVFREKGTERYIVADGEHRLLALQRAKIKKVAVRMHDGDEVAALDFAIGCNHAHGVRRTKADKYHAFVRIMETSLRDKYRTDTDLSEKIGVSKRTIADYKAQWRNSDSGGDRAAQRKKQEAREQAEKKTRNGLEARASLNGHKTAEEKPQIKATPKPKKDDDDGWTAADERGAEAISDALKVFCKVVTSQTRAAQIQMRDAALEMVRKVFA